MLTTSIIILALFVCAFGGFVIYDLVTAKKRKVVYRVKSSATAYLMLFAVGSPCVPVHIITYFVFFGIRIYRLLFIAA